MTQNAPVTKAQLEKALEPYATKIDLENATAHLVTKEELQAVDRRLDKKIDLVYEKLDVRIEDSVQSLMRHAEKLNADILHHFSDLVDGAHDQLAGANLDKFSLHDDTLKNHEMRIKHLETTT